MSSAHIRLGLLACLLHEQRGGSPAAAKLHPCQRVPILEMPLPASRFGSASDPAQIFQSGQDALNGGRLDEAERDFRQVLAANPQVGGAYANLGVVYMRRKQWTKALETLRKAEHLMPQVAGIRLNIGLAYFRQNEFLKAIPPFESVVQRSTGRDAAPPSAGALLFFRRTLGGRG